MPALIGGAIGGIANLIGGAIGSNSSKNAGNVLQAAGNTAATAIQGSAGNASSALQPYINSAQSGIGTAVTGAQGGINSAVTGAQGGIGSAVTGAQGGIGGAVQSGLAGGNTFLQGLSPYQQVGASGASQLNSLLAPGGSINTALNTNFAFNPSDMQNDPGYQFQLKQGLQAGQNQMTAAGLGNSGAAAKGATSYATGLAGTYFNNAYNRALSTYQNNRQNSLYQIQALMGTAGLGQTANQQALGATEYMGGLGLQGATTAGQLGLQGATTAGQLGLQGAETAGGLGLQGATQMGNWQLSGTEAAQQAAMTGAQGKAAGIMGSANAWQNALGGASNSLMGGLALNQMGQNGGYNVYWPSGSTSYDTDTGEYTYGGGG